MTRNAILTIQVLRAAGLETTHWGSRILAAMSRRGFTRSEVRDAAGWTTCACGKLNDGIPREDGVLLDYTLFHEGGNFAGFVDADNFLKAAHCLVTIEARAAEVRAGLARGGPRVN